MLLSNRHTSRARAFTVLKLDTAAAAVLALATGVLALSVERAGIPLKIVWIDVSTSSVIAASRSGRLVTPAVGVIGMFQRGKLAADTGTETASQE